MVHKTLDIKQQRIIPKWWERSPGRASGLPGLSRQSWESRQDRAAAVLGAKWWRWEGCTARGLWDELSPSWAVRWVWISINWGGNYSGVGKDQGCLLYKHPFKHPFQKKMLPLPLQARHVEKWECQGKLFPNITHPSLSYHFGFWKVFPRCK